MESKHKVKDDRWANAIDRRCSIHRHRPPFESHQCHMKFLCTNLIITQFLYSSVRISLVICYSQLNQIFLLLLKMSTKTPAPTNTADTTTKVKPLPFHYQFLAGGIAGTSEILIMYPLDAVKTRAQLNVVA